MENGNAQEIWETTTPGTFWVHVKDPREPGGWKQKRFGGKGVKKITLTVEEREFNQELVDEDRRELDPFANGLLVRVHPKDVQRGEYELSDDQLIAVLSIDDDDLFDESMRAWESEILLRRLLALAERHATKYRYDLVKETVDARYAIGKTSKVVKEIVEDDAKYADADL